MPIDTFLIFGNWTFNCVVVVLGFSFKKSIISFSFTPNFSIKVADFDLIPMLDFVVLNTFLVILFSSTTFFTWGRSSNWSTVYWLGFFIDIRTCVNLSFAEPLPSPLIGLKFNFFWAKVEREIFTPLFLM